MLVMTKADLDLMLDLAGGNARRLRVNDFFRVYQLDSGPVVAGWALGAPAAVMAAEKLFSLGVDKLLFTGWCGSLSPSAPAGSLILPQWAVSEEGTSAHYPVPRRPRAATDLIDALEAAAVRREVRPIRGPVWTTDAVYRETRAKIARYASEGVLAVEMETSALLAVAAFYRRRAAGLLVVSDEVHHSGWRPAFGSVKFKEARQKAAAVMLAAAESII